MRSRVVAVVALVLSCRGQQVEQEPAAHTVAPAAPHEVRDALPLRRFVVRIASSDLGDLGTGFIHVSGKVMTSHHVIAPAKSSLQIKIGDRAVWAKELAVDDYLDLALLEPEEQLEGGLRIGGSKDLAVGNTLVAWGFPDGYAGSAPLLTVGYCSGLGLVPTAKGPALRSYVNGAFNNGNSGGPLIDLRSLTVVGVVNAKMAVVPAKVRAAQEALRTQKATGVTEAVATILAHLESQTQLGVGVSVLVEDLHSFLEAKHIQP
jgi:S1-C subfamily serine protease